MTDLDELDEIFAPQIMNEDECPECRVNFKEAKQSLSALKDKKVLEVRKDYEYAMRDIAALARSIADTTNGVTWIDVGDLDKIVEEKLKDIERSK